jgi:hypothetical protein
MVTKGMLARRAILAALVGALFLATASAADGARTLARSPTWIQAFAQDGRFIAWVPRVAPAKLPCGEAIVIRNLETGRKRSFMPRITPCFSRLGLALGGKRALGLSPPTTCGNCVGATVWTAALGGRLAELGTFAQSPEGGGHRVTGMAGDKRLLAFSHLRYRLENEDCHPCLWNVTGGRVTRVVKGGQQISVPGVAPAALLAAGAGRLATAPALDPWEEAANVFPSPRPAEDGPVNLVNAKTGDPVMTVSPTGTVRALALSADALAVLVQAAPHGQQRIERYSIPDGTKLASTQVRPRGVHALDIAGKWIVYSAFHRIKLIDPLGHKQVLVRPAHRPIDVSIEGNRVAWAENGSGRHRIRATSVPE